MARKKSRRNRKVKVRIKFNKRWLIKTAAVLCFLLIVLAGIFFVKKAKTFDVRKSNVRSNVRLNKSVLDHINDNSIFHIDLEFMANNLMKENPEYKDVRIKKVFPKELVFEVDRRGYFAQVKGKMYYALDRDAVILSQGSDYPFENLIPIEYDDTAGNFKKGHHIDDKRLNAALELIELINREVIFSKFSIGLVNTSNSQGSYFLIQPKDGPLGSRSLKIIVGEGGYYSKIKNIKSLIEGELKEKMALVKYIDLRHKKIYVGFRR